MVSTPCIVGDVGTPGTAQSIGIAELCILQGLPPQLIKIVDALIEEFDTSFIADPITQG